MYFKGRGTRKRTKGDGSWPEGSHTTTMGSVHPELTAKRSNSKKYERKKARKKAWNSRQEALGQIRPPPKQYVPRLSEARCIGSLPWLGLT